MYAQLFTHTKQIILLLCWVGSISVSISCTQLTACTAVIVNGTGCVNMSERDQGEGGGQACLHAKTLIV